ncbi:MAG TPA: ADP-ribosylglycohydrolase family protein, partial [Gemmataceae bacterium]|nr:ADP-ribosylglycohydrolase family protein [Gemmataceae bacterium]
MPSEREIIGCLVGTAIGDALGLPHEGLSPRRARRLFPDVDHFHFLFGRGMFSDDTEHACMTAQCLLAAGGDMTRFSRSLAWRLRWWLVGCPLGTGRATLLSCIRLWLGFSAKSSGVNSAGNGPCMRAPVVGLAYGTESELLRKFVRGVTRITHTDPRAESAALVVAVATHLSAGGVGPAREVPERLIAEIGPGAGDLVPLIRRAANSVEAGQPTEAFAVDLGLGRGVSGFVIHTVPVVLHAWLRFPEDYASAVRSVIRCGGDTDTTAAIVGGIVGARVGVEGIPEEWRAGLAEWPRNL